MRARPRRSRARRRRHPRLRNLRRKFLRSVFRAPAARASGLPSPWPRDRRIDARGRAGMSDPQDVHLDQSVEPPDAATVLAIGLREERLRRESRRGRPRTHLCKAARAPLIATASPKLGGRGAGRLSRHGIFSGNIFSFFFAQSMALPGRLGTFDQNVGIARTLRMSDDVALVATDAPDSIRHK